MILVRLSKPTAGAARTWLDLLATDIGIAGLAVHTPPPTKAATTTGGTTNVIGTTVATFTLEFSSCLPGALPARSALPLSLVPLQA